jgi:DNA-binding PadR family transcriptional regulator
MFADNTLTPKEATRLCVLGTLALQPGPMHYGVLATAVRHFIDRILGPSLDLMGPSIELLKYEGLIRAVAGHGLADDALFELTDEGRQTLSRLLNAPIRNQATDLNKLIVALKFRFLHLLEADERLAQADLLIDYFVVEAARLDDLRHSHGEGVGFLGRWLDHDLALVETRLAWLREFRESLSAS